MALAPAHSWLAYYYNGSLTGYFDTSLSSPWVLTLPLTTTGSHVTTFVVPGNKRWRVTYIPLTVSLVPDG